MAWQIAFVADEGDSVEAIHNALWALLGQMPVWALISEDRVPGAEELRKGWTDLWSPEPALTLVKPSAGDSADDFVHLVPTMREHHPSLAAFRVFGIQLSERMQKDMKEFGFEHLGRPSENDIRFGIPFDLIPDAPSLELDAKKWNDADSFYDAFFAAVGAPDWHGRNLNAMKDSIATGAINEIDIPYRIVIRNARDASREAREMIGYFSELVEHLKSEGFPVDLRVE